MNIIAFCISSIALLFWGVDLLFYLKKRYCRFHIGRKIGEEWKRAVIKKARQWAVRMPTVQINENSRYMLWELISADNKDMSVQAFQSAALYLGLQDIGDRPSIKLGIVKSPDYAMLAYAILRETNDVFSIKEQMDGIYEMLKEATDENGLVAYTGTPEDDARFVDILGMICPFLVRYAFVYKIPEAEAMAFKQLEFYHNFGMYSDTFLPNHAISSKLSLPLGVYGWGRGTAWYVIGLTDTYSELQDGVAKDTIKLWIKEAAECYARFQNNDGGFNSILQIKKLYDSSVTAVFAWFYFKCADILADKKYTIIANKAMDKLCKSTRISGAIDYSQGDTKDIGVFSSKYNTMPFTQGFTLRAIALAGIIHE